MESPSFQDSQLEAIRKLSQWDQNMDCAADVAFGSFLVSAAREADVDMDKFAKLPMVSVCSSKPPCLEYVCMGSLV